MYIMCIIMHWVNSAQTDGAMYLKIASSWPLSLSYESDIFPWCFFDNHLKEHLNPNNK